jgi:ketosteroid isomerase-like protein
MRHKLVFLALLALLSFVGVSSSAQTRSQDGAEVRAADQEWARVFAAKDLKASVDFCADEASVLVPNAPIATGKQAISQAFAAFFAIPDFKISWHPSKVEVANSGELGYSTGVYEMTFKDAAGKAMSDHGKYVTIWKKQGGKWKVVSDIFNSDLPAAP